MKKLSIFNIIVMAWLVVLAVQAKPVTQQQALEKARSFIRGNDNGPRKMPRSNAPLMLAAESHYQVSQEQTAPCFYVFNVGNEGGFVIVSADDRTKPVLGYAAEGSFDEDAIPENMQAWLDEYARQMEWIASHDIDSDSPLLVNDSKVPAYRTPISPLLTTTWNQDEPYNNMCPVYNGNRCVTGCVATAMAQVLNYHRHPAQLTQRIPGFQSNTAIYVSAIEPTDIDWDNMLPSYNGSENTDQKNAVARLMLMCGASVKMNYGPGQSSADEKDAAVAMKKYFDYDVSTKYVKRNSYYYDEWVNLIYGELQAGRPVLYGGNSAGGGHAFVIDGYSSEDYFHVNWGWGGFCDNYFLLSILNSGSNSGIGASTSTDGYSFKQGAIINAKPNAGGVAEPYAMTSVGVSLAQTNYTRSSSNSDFSNVAITCEMFNYTGETVTFDIGQGIFNSAGEMVSAISCTYSNLPPNYGFFLPNYALNVKISFGKGMADGVYKICAISRERGTDTWLPNHDYQKYAVTATISGNTLTLQPPTVSLSGIMAAQGAAEVGKALPITATITNNGDDFNDDLMLYCDNTLVGGRHFEAAAGDTRTLELSYRPTQAGEQTLSLVFGNTDIATLTVNVEAAKAYSMTGTLDVTNVDGWYTIKGTTMMLQGTLTNNSAYTYDDDVKCTLYKVKEDGYGYSDATEVKLVTIAPGTTATIDFQFDNLEVGCKYFCHMYYKSEGEYATGDNTYSYTYSYTIEKADVPKTYVTAKSYSRQYGDENPVFEYTINGSTFDGEPLITCNADIHSPVGTYPIVISQGTVNDENVVFVNGTLTITTAPLTVTVDDKEKRQGTANPTFTFSYAGFKAGDDESSLTQKPIVATTATASSAMGQYEVKASGDLSANYSESYISGWLTIIGQQGDVDGDGQVNTTDVVNVVQYVLGKPLDVSMLAVDVNDDGDVSVADAVATNNVILDYNYDRATRSSFADDNQMADNFFASANDTVQPGESFTIDLSLQTDDMGQYVAYQFDLSLPKEMVLTDEGCTLQQDHYTDAQQTVTWKKVGDAYRFTCFSLSNRPLKGQSGVIAKVHVQMLDNAAEGLYTGTLRHVFFTLLDAQGNVSTVTMDDSQIVTTAVYETGIHELLILAKEGQTRIYSPDGKLLSKLQKGLNIIVMSDGSVRKIRFKE